MESLLDKHREPSHTRTKQKFLFKRKSGAEIDILLPVIVQCANLISDYPKSTSRTPSPSLLDFPHNKGNVCLKEIFPLVWKLIIPSIE